MPPTKEWNALGFVTRALVRHRGMMALFFVASMTLVVAALLLSTPAYRSQARLYVRLGRGPFRRTWCRKWRRRS